MTKAEVRWGLIGCGDVAQKRVADALENVPHSHLLAACRRDVSALEMFADQFQVPARYASDTDLLADPQVDAVYIATPVACHLSQTVAAAEAGKHVLVEKPMALSVAECDRMIEACRTNGVLLAVAYYRRFYPLVARIEELLAERVIGRPLAVSASTSTSLAMPPDGNPWRVIPDEGGGGALMDIGSHRLNLFVHLFGEPVDVQAVTATVGANYDADQSAALMMRFSGGELGLLECHFRGGNDPDEFSITGSRGRLTARPLNGDELIIDQNGKVRKESHPPADNLCSPLVHDFVNAILAGRKPRITGEEGRAANAVMERAYAAARATAH